MRTNDEAMASAAASIPQAPQKSPRRIGLEYQLADAKRMLNVAEPAFKAAECAFMAAKRAMATADTVFAECELRKAIIMAQLDELDDIEHGRSNCAGPNCDAEVEHYGDRCSSCMRVSEVYR